MTWLALLALFVSLFSAAVAAISVRECRKLRDDVKRHTAIAAQAIQSAREAIGRGFRP
jgi:hypothetical protein